MHTGLFLGVKRIAILANLGCDATEACSGDHTHWSGSPPSAHGGLPSAPPLSPRQVFLHGLDLATCPQISGYACFPLNKSQVIF